MPSREVTHPANLHTDALAALAPSSWTEPQCLSAEQSVGDPRGRLLTAAARHGSTQHSVSLGKLLLEGKSSGTKSCPLSDPIYWTLWKRQACRDRGNRVSQVAGRGRFQRPASHSQDPTLWVWDSLWLLLSNMAKATRVTISRRVRL